jgi:hypothetical protein
VSRFRRAVALDDGDRRADLDLALGDDDLDEPPVHLRLDLLGHLVGVELVQRFALLHRVSFGLQPAHDHA